MSEALKYFKKVYDVVPGWVQKMHDYQPEVLNHYTNLRGVIMTDGELSLKDKDILLVGMNEGRLYARSMVYHTKGAIDGGATLEELAEYLLVGYLVGGEKALQIGLQSFEYALELLGIDADKISHDSRAEKIAEYYGSFVQDEQFRTYFEELALLFSEENNNALEEKLLSSNYIDKSMKHLMMTGIYTVKLDNSKTNEWAKKARKAGASEKQLAELGHICLLTAGIPAWFEISDALLEK